MIYRKNSSQHLFEKLHQCLFNNQVALTFQTKEVSNSVSVEKIIMQIPYIETKLTSVEEIELLFVRGQGIHRQFLETCGKATLHCLDHQKCHILASVQAVYPRPLLTFLVKQDILGKWKFCFWYIDILHCTAYTKLSCNFNATDMN